MEEATEVEAEVPAPGEARRQAPAAPGWLAAPPAVNRPQLPETPQYRLKRLLLGRPLVSEELRSERLGKPTALAVLSSDVMSSCAYASESILRILLPAAGVAAFVLVTPVTMLLLLVLGLVCLCYRQVVKAYPVSGGSYVVSRENFGYSVAQIPAAALLCSYTLTVAVQVAAAVYAIISAFPALGHSQVPLSIGCIVVLAYGNLRGIREAGRIFALPTYWFFLSMGALFVTGIVRIALEGHLHQYPVHGAGLVHVGSAGGGLLLGAGLFIFLRGFANGGSAMTGMEAVSNAVPIFRPPEIRNARTTLALMASILGAMFIGVSAFAAVTHATPHLSGTPSVLSEIGRAVFGQGTLSALPYYSLQFSTALILFLGANTSFNGFPMLVSFIARDAYLPRPLVTRGHRLVFSNGIFLLTVASVALILATRAQLASLIPLYACTVFTGFTMSGAGMTKYHLTHREPGRRRSLVISASAFVASACVTGIFVVTEFSRGAWLVVVAIPLLVLLLTRTHRRYVAESGVLAEDAAAAATEAPVLRNHVLRVLVDRLDLATARGIQLARSLATSGEVRAVHFVIDAEYASRLTGQWGQLGLSSIPLELVECRDRRLARAAMELAADLATDGRTEVTFILPRRAYRGALGRFLHDNTADRLAAAVSKVPHASATIVAFDVATPLSERRARLAAPAAVLKHVPLPMHHAGRMRRQPGEEPERLRVEGATPIGELVPRNRARVAGRISSMRVQPLAGVPTLECTLVDGTGAIDVVFLGRRSIAGFEPGTRVAIEGMVGRHRGQLAIINPAYDFISAGDARQAN